MWCNEGLECVIDVTADKYNALITRLKGEEFIPQHNLFHMRLRAQYNPQRHYEIYFVGVDDEIETQDIKEMFEADPQSAADIIRQRGECFYSDRISTQAVIV
jgi:hypothetical protein